MLQARCSVSNHCALNFHSCNVIFIHVLVYIYKYSDYASRHKCSPKMSCFIHMYMYMYDVLSSNTSKSSTLKVNVTLIKLLFFYWTFVTQKAKTDLMTLAIFDRQFPFNPLVHCINL